MVKVSFLRLLPKKKNTFTLERIRSNLIKLNIFKFCTDLWKPIYSRKRQNVSFLCIKFLINYPLILLSFKIFNIFFCLFLAEPSFRTLGKKKDVSVVFQHGGRRSGSKERERESGAACSTSSERWLAAPCQSREMQKKKCTKQIKQNKTKKSISRDDSINKNLMVHFKRIYCTVGVNGYLYTLSLFFLLFSAHLFSSQERFCLRSSAS